MSEEETTSVEPQEQNEEQEQVLPDPSMLLSYVGMQMDTRDLIKTLSAVFDAHAWRSLGLIADPRTGAINPDLPVAQIAIDCVQFLLSKAEGDLSDEERRDAHRRLNDLRVNYLNKTRS